MNNEQLFNNFLTEISNQVEQNIYSIWFSKLKLLSIINDVITITVQMDIQRDMLSTTYSDLISTTLTNITGKTYTIKYITEDEVENFTKPIPENIPENIEEEPWKTNLNPKFTFENYIVGNSNRLAFIAAKDVAEHPGEGKNPLFIYGRSGLGKTHLMQAIGNFITENSEKKVLYTTSNQFMEDYILTLNQEKNVNKNTFVNNFKNKYRNIDVLIIDDIQFLVGAEKTQEEFFHIFNTLHQANKQIIISSDKSPDDLKRIEERLRSRFRWGLPVDIYPPDFNTRCEIIKLKIANTCLVDRINNDVIEYIANFCVNDVRHIEGTINRLLANVAMMEKNMPEITLDFAIMALNDYVNTNVFTSNSIEGIQKAVAEYFKIRVEDLKSKRRTNLIVRPRHIAMYLCRMETDENLAKIGLEFGGRDHSTVSTAIDRIKDELENDEELKKTLLEIKALL